MLILHAYLHTMEEQDFPDGYLRFLEGRITALGPMEEAPQPEPGEEVLDVAGASVMPGMVDAHTHLGMWEDALCFEGDDGNEETDPVTPQLRAIDAVNPMDRCFAEAAAGGITTVLTGPGSANAIAGS